MKALSIILLIVAMGFIIGCTEVVVEQPTADVVVNMPTDVAAPAVHEVLISTSGLIPLNLDINVGDTVEWVNMDTFESYETDVDSLPRDELDIEELFEERTRKQDGERLHTITFNNGQFDIQVPVGGSASYTFTESGVYEYISMHDPNLQGAIHVR